MAFLDAPLSAPDVRAHLSGDEIRQCLSLEHRRRHLPTTLQRVLGEE